jgi:hypothetical protein
LQPDGTYKVRNVTNSNFLNAIVISEQITYANLLALATANELVAGKNYTITDAVGGTMSLYVFAVSISNLAEYGYDTTTGQAYSYDLATDTASNADNTGFINFTPQTAPAYQRGRMWYDSTTETVSYYDEITGTSVQVGQEELVRARNSTGSKILNGAVVYISGAQGQNPRISLAQANAENTSRIIGVATHNISNNTVGKVCTFGIVGDLNTSAYNEGDVLYLSTSVAGGLTTTRPSAPNQAVMVGTVVHSAVNNGKILVHTDNYGIGYGTANQVRGMNAAGTAEEYKTLTGTTNQVTVTNAANAVTFSLPQSIATNSNVQFANITATQFIKFGGLSTEFLKADGSVDTNTYLTGNQTITLSGQASGSGATSISVTLDNAAVINKVLTGLSVSGSAIVSTDSILVALGKVQNQINALAGGVSYQGTWNASTNTPALTSSVGTKGYYYVVSVAGSTDLNGITDWKLGDWVIFNGSTWDKVDNTDAVISVNGYTGIVTLAKADIGLGNVENTALSTWAGSTNITTLGTIGTGTWQGTAIGDTYISSASTWNAKIGGSGTSGKLAKFTASGTIGDSIVSESGGVLGLNTTPSNWGTFYTAIESTSSSEFCVTSKLNGIEFGRGYYKINAGFGNVYTDGQAPSKYNQAADGSHLWYNASSGVAGNTITFTERLRINPSGSIITANAPDTGEAHIFGGSARVNGDLTVAPTNDASARQFIANTSFIGTGNGINGFQIRVLGSSVDGIKISNAANNVDYLSIASTGAATFSSSVTANGAIESTNSTIRNVLSYSGSFGVLGTLSNHGVQIWTNTNPVVTVTSGGNVGIGTTSPNVSIFSKALTISSANSGIELTSASNVLQGSISANTNGLVLEGVGANGIRFFTSASGASSENMRITDAGNVGIGTTTPGSKLSVVGLPTSASGLSAGDIWNDGGTLKIV